MSGGDRGWLGHENSLSGERYETCFHVFCAPESWAYFVEHHAATSLLDAFLFAVGNETPFILADLCSLAKSAFPDFLPLMVEQTANRHYRAGLLGPGKQRRLHSSQRSVLKERCKLSNEAEQHALQVQSLNDDAVALAAITQFSSEIKTGLDMAGTILRYDEQFFARVATTCI